MGIGHSKEHKQNYGIPKQKINYDNCENVVTREIPLEGVKARVDRVHINGLCRTKDGIIKDAVKDLFTAQDFKEVLFKAHKVRTKLDSLGCFRNIAVFIDTSKGPGASSNGVEITYHVKEFKRVVGGVNTEVGDNEGFLMLGVCAPNLLGCGERLQTHFIYGSKKTNKIELSFIKPFKGKHNPVFTASVYQSSSEWPISSYRDLNRGVVLDFGINSFSCVKHNLQWGVALREISLLNRSSSFDVREESGVYLKSALRHILSIDLRDNIILPSCGSLFQLTSELAGLGGDIGFVKNDVYIQANYSILKNFVLQASFLGGILRGFNENWKITMPDMYFLGGPLSLRGFQTRGVAPYSEGDALGSGWFWSSGLHLYTPLPFISAKEGFGELIRTHFFVNAGNRGDSRPDDDRTIMDQISQNVRIAYGVGLAIRLGQMARVELNYCIPHRFDSADKLQQGFQFGIGVQFL